MRKFSHSLQAVGKITFTAIIIATIIFCSTIAVIAYSSLSSLQNRYTTLMTDYNELASNYEQLQTRYRQLESSQNTTQTQLTNLQSSYNQLDNQYNQLNSQYQSLLSATNSTGKISIDAINYNSNGTLPAGITQVIVRNLGSTSIQVTSLKLFTGNILVSSTAVSTEIQADSTATFDQFIPFTLSANVYTLKITTAEGYSVTSDPIYNG